MQLVIELPPRAEQLALNRRRWEKLCADPELARIPGRIETNAHGQMIMSPPPGAPHSQTVRRIQRELERLLGGLALPECPISTMDGVRAADVGWYSDDRFAEVDGQLAFELAPEICVEVLSPANTDSEMRAKRKLYFDSGAKEVWICGEDGQLAFYTSADTTHPVSTVCPKFPVQI